MARGQAMLPADGFRPGRGAVLVGERVGGHGAGAPCGRTFAAGRRRSCPRVAPVDAGGPLLHRGARPVMTATARRTTPLLARILAWPCAAAGPRVNLRSSGIAVPATWEEVTAAAEKLKAGGMEHPIVYEYNQELPNFYDAFVAQAYGRGAELFENIGLFRDELRKLLKSLALALIILKT